MIALKVTRKLLEQSPEDPDAQRLARLVLALESDAVFDLSELYAMDMKTFELALAILKKWRLDRYYASKVKLFDIAYQVQVSERQ